MTWRTWPVTKYASGDGRWATSSGARTLERETLLLTWLTDLAGRDIPVRGRAWSARRDPALRRARDLLLEEPAANVTFAQLAAAAGASRHRLTRLFRCAYGLPPHRFQLAQRLRLAHAPPADGGRASARRNAGHCAATTPARSAVSRAGSRERNPDPHFGQNLWGSA